MKVKERIHPTLEPKVAPTALGGGRVGGWGGGLDVTVGGFRCHGRRVWEDHLSF